MKLKRLYFPVQLIFFWLVTGIGPATDKIPGLSIEYWVKSRKINRHSRFSRSPNSLRLDAGAVTDFP